MDGKDVLHGVVWTAPYAKLHALLGVTIFTVQVNILNLIYLNCGE